MKKYATILGILVSLTALVGFGFAVDKRFAKQCDHQKLEQAFYYDKTVRRMQVVQERMWSLEKRYPAGMPEVVREEYNRLKLELILVLKKLELKGE